MSWKNQPETKPLDALLFLTHAASNPAGLLTTLEESQNPLLPQTLMPTRSGLACFMSNLEEAFINTSLFHSKTVQEPSPEAQMLVSSLK